MWKKVIPVAAVLILAWIGLNLMTAKDEEESVAHAPDTASGEVSESTGAEAEAVTLTEITTADETPAITPMSEESADVAGADLTDEEPAADVAEVAPADEALAVDPAEAASTDEEPVADVAQVAADEQSATDAASTGEATDANATAEATTDSAETTGTAAPAEDEANADSTETVADASEAPAENAGSTVIMRYPADPVTGATIYDQGMVEVVIEPTVEPAEEESAATSEENTDAAEPAEEDVAATEPEEIVEPVTVNRSAMRYPTDPVTGATLYDQGMVEVEFESVVEPGEEVADTASDQAADASEADAEASETTEVSDASESAEGKGNSQMRYPTDPVTGATLYDQGMVEVVIESDTETQEVAQGDAEQASENAAGENAEPSDDDATETAASEAPAEPAPDAASEDSSEGGAMTEGAESESGNTATKEVAKIAERGTFSLGAISRTLGGVFGTTTTVLSSARDKASAQAVLPRLEAAGKSLNSIADQYATLPEYAKGPLAKVIKRGMAQLKPLADTALTREGVGPVLMPVMEPMLESMQTMLR